MGVIRFPSVLRGAAALFAALLLLTGCTPDAEPANDLDRARVAALADVLWSDVPGSHPGGPAVTGADRPFERPHISWFETRPGTVEDAVRVEVGRARAAGWVPVYGDCAEMTEDWTADDEPFLRTDEIVAHLSRDLPDGSPAYAEIIVMGNEKIYGADGAPTGLRHLHVSVSAHTLYHLDTITPEPLEQVNLEALECVGGGGGTRRVGTEMPVGSLGHVDRPDKS